MAKDETIRTCKHCGLEIHQARNETYWIALAGEADRGDINWWSMCPGEYIKEFRTFEQYKARSDEYHPLAMRERTSHEPEDALVELVRTHGV